MNSVTPISAERHQQIQLLLPWYINHSLGEYEQQQVVSHLHSCTQCSRELFELRNLSAAVNRASDLDVAAEVSFADLRTKMRSRLPAQQKSKVSVSGHSKTFGLDKLKHIASGRTDHHATYWLRGILTSQWPKANYLAVAASLLLALTPLAVLTWQSTSTNDYYTLSANKLASSDQGALHVVFGKSLTDAGIDDLLLQIHARRIEGPNSIGAYTVQVDNAEDTHKLANAITFLRKQPFVMLVEPITHL